MAKRPRIGDDEIEAFLAGSSATPTGPRRMTDEQIEAFLGVPTSKSSLKKGFQRLGRKAGAATMGFAKGISFGLADDIVGAVGALGEKAANPRARSFAEEFKGQRDIYRQREAAARAELGRGAAIPEFFGTLASFAIPGLNIAKGASSAARVSKAAGLGALRGAGSSEAPTAGGVAREAGRGAMAGLLGGGMSEYAGRMPDIAARRLVMGAARPVPRVPFSYRGVQLPFSLSPADKAVAAAGGALGALSSGGLGTLGGAAGALALKRGGEAIGRAATRGAAQFTRPGMEPWRMAGQLSLGAGTQELARRYLPERALY